MSDQPARKNIFLTDENVDGSAIELARTFGVTIIRDVDIDIPCDIDDYDQCLFDYAVEHGYIVVTVNVRDFAPKFARFLQSGIDHPGIIFIPKTRRRSHRLIADWLDLWSDEDFTNRQEWI